MTRRLITTLGALIAVVGFVQANPLKQRLVQQKAKELAAVACYNDDDSCVLPPLTIPDLAPLPDCNCTFTQIPALGAGLYEGYS